jgi:hypothetical protein
MNTTTSTTDLHHTFTAVGGGRSLFVEHARQASLCRQVKIHATRQTATGYASVEIEVVDDQRVKEPKFTVTWVAARGGGRRWGKRHRKACGSRAEALAFCREKLAACLAWLEGIEPVASVPLERYL